MPSPLDRLRLSERVLRALIYTLFPQSPDLLPHLIDYSEYRNVHAGKFGQLSVHRFTADTLFSVPVLHYLCYIGPPPVIRDLGIRKSRLPYFELLR